MLAGELQEQHFHLLQVWREVQLEGGSAGAPGEGAQGGGEEEVPSLPGHLHHPHAAGRPQVRRHLKTFLNIC